MTGRPTLSSPYISSSHSASVYELRSTSFAVLLSLKTDLANAQTDLVNASAQYNSMIRESEMVKLMNQRNLGLDAPLDPPYELKSK